MKETQRPTMADLWKNFEAASDERKPAAASPAVAINTVHGSVVSIITSQPIQLTDLLAQACAAKKEAR